MAKQVIKYGDFAGDTNPATTELARESFRKAKENFDELYNRPQGDMLKSAYDSNEDGVVDLAEGILGIDAAGNAQYYGKDAAGNKGFHDFQTQIESVVFYLDRASFPTPGVQNRLYIDKTGKGSYIWDASIPDYVVTAGVTDQMITDALGYTPAKESEVVKSVTGTGVDNTDPQNPVISQYDDTIIFNGVSYYEDYIFSYSEINITGFMRVDGSTSANTSYIRSGLLPCKGGIKLYITSRVASSSVSPAVFFDENQNYISGYAATDTNLTTHEIDVPENAHFFVTSLIKTSEIDIKWDVFIAHSFFTNKKTQVFVSVNGNNNAAGDYANPLATIDEAKKRVRLGDEIVLLEGDYEDFIIPDIEGIRLRGVGEVRIINYQQKITSATLENGYTKVYKSDNPVALDANTVNLWQHDIPSHLININDRHEYNKNNQYRLSATKLVEAIDLNDIENSTELKYFESGGYLYFSKSPNSDLTVNPIIEPYYNPNSINTTNIHFESISLLYEPLIFTDSNSKLKRCRFLFANRSLIDISGVSFVEIEDCETAGSSNDGIGIRDFAEVKEIRHYSHDNDDEGSSAHGESKVFRENCFFEHNASSDTMDVNSSQSTLINCIGKSNVTFGTSFQEINGADYGSQILIDCTSYGSITTNLTNRVKAYNPLLVGGSIDAKIDTYRVNNLTIGQEVKNEAPDPVNPTDVAIKRTTEGATGTGTELSLAKTAGTRYNLSTPSNASTFTFINPVKGGFATSFVQYTQAELDALTGGYPEVTGATKLTVNPTLQADTKYELVLESLDGTNVRYYFLEC